MPVKPLVIHKDAQRELAEARDYYRNISAELGKGFRAEIEAALNWVRRFPQAGSFFGRTPFRKHLVRRFPYTIIFREDARIVWIIAIAHQKRRPGYWSGRSFSE